MCWRARLFIQMEAAQDTVRTMWFGRSCLMSQSCWSFGLAVRHSTLRLWKLSKTNCWDESSRRSPGIGRTLDPRSRTGGVVYISG